jgi:hypothetical protein
MFEFRVFSRDAEVGAQPFPFDTTRGLFWKPFEPAVFSALNRASLHAEPLLIRGLKVFFRNGP